MRWIFGALLAACIFQLKWTPVQASGTPAFEQRKVNLTVLRNPEDFNGLMRTELGAGTDYSWKQTAMETDQAGGSHTRFTQLFRGIPVTGGMLILHENKNGAFITGTFVLVNLVNDDLPKQEATEKLINERFLKAGKRSTDGLTKGGFTWQTENNGKVVNLVYAVEFYPENSLELHSLVVNASTMEIISEVSASCHADVNGMAATAYYGTQVLPTFQDGTSFILKTTSRGQGIFTKNLNYQMNFQHVNEFTDNDNNWVQPALPGDQYATDAHYCAVHYYDFLDLRFNRNSIDNNGYPLKNYLNYGTSVVNAFWNGQAVVYGGGNSTTTPLTTLDIAGHEFTHGLIQKTAGLNYSGEPGTINEAIADIFGVALEHDQNPQQANWLVGEQSGTTLRSFIQPTAFNQPCFYHGTNWYYGTGDQGGVHINSGFINKWFYILTQGEQGINEAGHSYQVNGIGIQEATQIVYHALVSYLMPASGFEDFRTYTLQSAIDLHGNCSPEYNSVLKAWDAVGLGNSTLQPVTEINGDAAICPGASVKIFVSHYPGSIYTWQHNGQVINTGTTPEYIVSQPGSWSVSLQRCNATLVSSEIEIHQHLLPVVSANNAVTCAGIPVLLQGYPEGGTFSVSNPYFGPSANFTYTITDTNGCSAQASGNITVHATASVNILNGQNEFPVNNAPVLLLSDQPGTFSGTGVSGNFFYPELAGAGITAPVYLTVSGDYGCVAKDSMLFTVTEPCIRDHDSITIKADEPSVTPGSIVSFHVNIPVSGFRIKWILPEGCTALSSAEEEQINIKWGNQDALIRLQLINTCNDTVYKQLRIAISGEKIVFEMHLYPNPATDFLNIRLPETPASGMQLIISDNSGKIVVDKTLESEITSIDTRHLSTGIYLVSVTGRHGIAREKHIIN